MRRCLCTVLLSCCLAVGSLMANDFTDNHAQQILTAAQSAKPNGKGVDATLSIGGKNVVFTVTRDSLGNVTATPEAGSGLTIGLVKMQLQPNDKGLLVPTALQVVSTSSTVTSYAISYDTATKKISGVTKTTGGSDEGKALVGGIGGASGSLGNNKDKDLPKDRYPDFKAGQLGYPDGTKPGQVRRPASPAVP